MVKIFSPMSGGNPLGETIANLGRQLFGDRTANEFKSEQLYAAQRENAETDNLMKRAAASGVENLGSDPIAQALLIGSGYDPKKFGDIGLMGAATGYGARDPRTQNWQVGTGQSFDNTAGAFDAKLAETTRANNLASSDRRYNTDQTQGTERWKHGTVGADQAVDNAEVNRHNLTTEGETYRNNNMTSADRLYDTNLRGRETTRHNTATEGETYRSNNLASGDRRYNTDQSQGTERWKHSTVGADQAVDNAETNRHNTATEGETYRNNDLASGDRRYNTDQTVGQQRYEFDNKPTPVIVDGRPVYAPQGGAVGQTPVISESDQKGTLLGQNFDNLPALNPNQQEVLGARVDGSKASTPRNYIVGDKSFITYDGVTSAQTGQPLPPGGYIGNVEGGAGDVGLTNSTQSGVQQGILANNKLSNLLAATREIARKDPTNFGIPGFIKGVAQDVSQIAQGLAKGFGYEGAEQFVDDVARRAAQSGVDPNLISGVFDPDLSSLHTLSDLMVYASAEALAGQSGRSVSDKDVQFFKSIVGDPTGWMMSQEKYLAKLTQIERILKMNQSELGQAQTEGAVPRTAAPPSTQGQTQGGVKWRVVQ